MTLKSCILTLFIVYPVFGALGYWFHRYIQRTRPNPLPPGDPRIKILRHLRFALYVILLPLGATLSLAILGALDPLFHVIVALRR
jgi:hypothetical protein